MKNKNKKRTPVKRASSSTRKSKNTFKTKNGKTIKLNRSLADKWHASRDARARRKALRLAGMPKTRIKRFFYRLHPKRMYRYWFSREGGIMALKVTGICIIAGFLTLVGLFAYFRKDLPNLRDISGNNIGGSIRYYDRTGENLLWEDYDAVKRVPVEDDEIAQVMKDATIAIEDQEFFSHGGFDVRGITRAAVANITDGETTQGGSTVTQQLVKLTQEWTEDRTYTRKIKELILAVELERTYTKQEILVGYLNTAPYGDITYGVEAAMQDYFDKPASKITLDEAAFLAAIPQSPTFLSPYGANYNQERLIGRQHYILDLMAEQDYITSEERDEAKDTDTLAKITTRRFKYDNITAPWFVLTAKERLQERCEETVQCGGWKVITTLDLDKQREAEEQVAAGLPQVQRQGGDSIAFVAEEVDTGHVVALVGGTDFDNDVYGQNNYARMQLPPGSSFKPYDYLSLMESSEDFGAGSVLYDTRGPIDGYPCTNASNCLRNYDRRYPGPLTLRYALGGSRNVPAVKAMLIAGVDTTIETAEKLGLESGYNCYLDDALTNPGPCYASSAIGDGAYLRLDEHVHAFSTISRNGNKIDQTYILRIEDASGTIVDEWEPTPGEQVVREDSAYIVSDILADPRASYMSRKPHNFNGHRFSVKTGTTNDSKDGWMMGYSTQYSAGVWVGYHNRQVEMTGFMENMTQPILQGWMEAIHRDLEPKERPRPEGIQVLPAFIVRNHVGASSIEPSPERDIYPSWYGKNISNERQTIDVVSKKLATECTPPRAREEVTGGDASRFSGDTFVNQDFDSSEQDDVHDCNDIKPSVALNVTETGTGYSIGAIVEAGTHPLHSEDFPGTVRFTINGETVKNYTITSGGAVPTFNYKPNYDGTRTLKVEVIDSVLYDGSDTMKLSSIEQAAQLEITSAESNGLQTDFSWSGGVGTVEIRRSDDNSLICDGSADGACSLKPAG
ncbi:MAG: transglycosylase domain-containing protein [Candidatus Saccharibacteria bacterium]|nr:transglycosylase domain-containing protein [Candidatus Saccharibacteria bacterium]